MNFLSKNERRTENFVREHFRVYKEQLIIEEQISDNPKIKKLLLTASKSGIGRGCPEFIIQYKSNPDFIIIVECKADVTKHESANRDICRDYSVDGALLYSSYLSRDFDVLSIAVSGERLENLKISHFLQLKGEKKAIKKFANKLLAPVDYLEGYLKSPEKFRQDYDKLLSFSKELNEKLHSQKILESDRGLLISCILIALENTAFSKSYKDFTKPDDLARQLVDTVEMEFKNSGIQEQKLRIIRGRFSFIKTDTSLSTKDGVLRDIITDIKDNVNTFIKTHEYFDVLGQLYIEFLRYANSDKGLGIVLTPPHITEFMAELAEINKDSVVYDSCAGTGGFLVSAMNLMIKDTKDDRERINSIKQNQLVGVEYQAHIFALACSNMFIHQDGKTNILNGSCFDTEIINKIKELYIMARPKTQLNRRTEILDAAQKLFNEKGFEKTTMQEIADFIGIGKGSVYLDFKNKDEIYVAIAERYAISHIENLKHQINNAKSPYLESLEKILINHPLEVYDMAIFRMQGYAALIHTSYQVKQKLRHVIQELHKNIGCMLNKAAKNDEIQEYKDFEVLSHLLHISLQGFFPPYDIKYSPEHRNDLSKEEIRDLLEKDLSIVVKIILSGLKTVKYEHVE